MLLDDDDYDVLKQEHSETQAEVSQLQGQLQRTQLEHDQLRIENARLTQEIDRLKSNSSINTSVETPSLSNSVRAVKTIEVNQLDELKHLSPCEITPEQAETFSREIHCR